MKDEERELIGLLTRLSTGGWQIERHREAHQAAATRLRALIAERDGLVALTDPYSNCDGDLPDYDHPLRCVYESGIQYAVDLLAKTLNVENYEVCDGTEEFDGDLSGTMFNIVLATMPIDAHGEPMHPSEVRAALQPKDTDNDRAD